VSRIDLGTANTVVSCGGEGTGGSGVVLDEPSVMLVGAGGRRAERVASGMRCGACRSFAAQRAVCYRCMTV